MRVVKKKIIFFFSLFTFSLFSMHGWEHRMWKRWGFNFEERIALIADLNEASARLREKERKSEQAKRDLKKGLKFLAAKAARDYYCCNDKKLKKDILKLITTETLYKYEYYRNKHLYCDLSSFQLSDDEED